MQDKIPPPFSSSTHLNLSHWVPKTGAEGPGQRFALWVQGCAIRCPSCCNPEMFGFFPKQLLTVPEVVEMIRLAQEQHQIEGISCLGGEPFAQAEQLAVLAEAVQSLGLSVMIFSGYTLDDIHARQDPHAERLLAHTDILIDGPYMEAFHTEERRWIGSTNQRIHFLSGRYDPEDPCWKQKNSVEVFFDGQELRITGFPKKEWRDEVMRWRRQVEQARAANQTE
jgi:anaerobic ribonucleoside-triphosphate reductase activating protein